MSKKKGQKDVQNNTQKTKNQGTRTPHGVELKCSGRVGSSSSTCGTGCVTLVTTLIISRE